MVWVAVLISLPPGLFSRHRVESVESSPCFQLSIYLPTIPHRNVTGERGRTDGGKVGQPRLSPISATTIIIRGGGSAFPLTLSFPSIHYLRFALLFISLSSLFYFRFGPLVVFFLSSLFLSKSSHIALRQGPFLHRNGSSSCWR